MKLRYILTTMAAVLTLAASCQVEGPTQFDEVQVSSSFAAIPVAGGSYEITVNATDAWTIVASDAEKGLPEWLTISPMSGAKGETKVSFSAQAVDGNNETVVYLKCGNAVQTIKVIQGIATVQDATCAEIIAGPDSKTYRVTGAVSRITETASYGNWYIKDETDEVYIYGTKYEGKTKQGALEKLGIEIGDVLTIEGPKTTYNGTVELVDVDIIKVVKSLLTIVEPEVKVAKEAGVVDFKLVYKGEGLKVEPQAEWLSLAGIDVAKDTTIVSIHVDANEEDTRVGTVRITSAIPGQETEAFITITQATGLSMYTLPYAEDFSTGIGAFEIQVISPREDEGDIWSASSHNGTNFMKASAWNGGEKKAYPSVSMLVSPKISLSGVASPVLTFEHAGKNFGDQLYETGLWVSTDNCETWTQLYMPQHDNNYGWQPSGDISLASLVGKEYFQIGFKYTSTTENAGTWEIANVKVEDRAAEFKSIAEINNSATSAKVDFTATLTDAVVKYVSGGNAFIEDATAGVQLFKKEHGLEVGTKINGTVKGKITLYNGFAEMTDINLSEATVSEVDKVVPTEIALDVLLRQYLRWQNCLVKVPALKVSGSAGGTDKVNVALADTDALTIRTQDAAVKINPGTYDVTCIPTRYNANLQIGVWEEAHLVAAE